MVRLRQIVLAGVGGAMLLLTGCAMSPFNGCGGCRHGGLFSRLGLRNRGAAVATEAPPCAGPVMASPVSDFPSYGDGGGFIGSAQGFGGSSPACNCGPNGSVPAGEFYPGGDGPVLPPAGTFPGAVPHGTMPFPGTMPPGAIPGGVMPAAPPGTTLPTPGEARPVPAGPSSRRA